VDDSASDLDDPGREPSRTESRPQYLGIDEVRERSLPVDLDDGELRAVPALELPISGDVYERELEAELGLGLTYDLERALAERAVGRVVDDDPGRYGYRPLVVVASATRCTARPYDASRRVVS
jgi:hypothetical protein